MIPIKEKKCKGTGKAKGHGCGTMAYKRTYGLCQKCFNNWLLSTDEGQKVLDKTLIRAKKTAVKEFKKSEREKIDSMKSIARLINEARTPFQAYIRQRDANLSCAACGTVNAEIWHAGHLYKAELYTGLIFDERNVHKCCNKCNIHKGGNETEYKRRLTERFGPEWMQKLDEDSKRLRTYDFTRDELKQIKTKYLKRNRNDR